ncbi:hypothetical protein FSP39_013119 [Pinctada imbricata]|uniref:LIM zinc-binding domain-containing protein n=1 Tax=Pinctada imbricata TaxID=66713 RepID=A0AA89BNI1_PINIB|nr:hypothetical protein FSP39_013119 [Pinctada imbricata]
MNHNNFDVVNMAKEENELFQTVFTVLLGGGEKCGVCGKSVYAAERQEAGKIIYHKLCFKCSECKMSLKLNNYAQADKVLYCKKHYQEIVVAKNTQSTNVY